MLDDAVIRLRLEISYAGTAFSGWAVQPGRRTVAGVLAIALETLFREPVPMVVAGRTDAGVHAIGQVAHVDVPKTALTALAPRHLSRSAADLPAPESSAVEWGMTGLRRRLAGLLPLDVRVFGVSVAAPGFDARFAALRRHYRYRIVSTDWGVPPLMRHDSLHWRRALNVSAMRRAADQLIGLHDFAAYCKPRDGATTVRELQRLAVSEEALSVGVGQSVHIDVSADAFCHSMVRSLVGALLAVGDGRRDPARPAALLAARTRTAEIAVAPARGLTLVAVDYPPEDQLAERVTQTRALRADILGFDCAE